MVIIRKAKINSTKIMSGFKSDDHSIGSIVSFTGYVRDFSDSLSQSIKYLYIEHYEDMTKKTLETLEKKAKSKWKLTNVTIFHRYGNLKPGDLIVMVIVSSMHRDDSFDACRYIVDHLKVYAPFWKKEISGNDSAWVDQKNYDLKKINKY